MKKISKTLSRAKLKISSKELSDFHDKAVAYRYNVDQVEELAVINKKLVTKIFKLIDIEEKETEFLVPESTKEIKRNYTKEFIEEILDVFKNHNYRIHATSSAEQIMKEGLLVRDENREINYTSLMFANKTDNEILYSLFNDMHKGQTQIIVLDADNEDLVEYKNKYKVPQERIKCYIDISTQTVTYNPHYRALNRGGEREVDKENVEIEGNHDFSFNEISSQIKSFEYLNKTNTREDISETNTRIHEYLMQLLLVLDKLVITQEEKEKLIYYISQVDNDVYKSLKTIKEEEKKKDEIFKKNPIKTDSNLSLDDTDGLF